MKFLFLLLLIAGLAGSVFSQKATEALPLPLYIRMIDSTTSIDVVFMLGQGGSISLEGRNTRIMNKFFDWETTPKLNAPEAGTIMWEINGKEFLSGKFYLGDSTGCLIINKNGKEYVNRINPTGTSFLKSQGKKH